MIQSMTGYGKAEAHCNGKKIHIEIKSLNSKALDLSARIAPLYREKEIEIRKYLAQALERGKVDFSIWVEKDADRQATPINPFVVSNYKQQIEAISKDLAINAPTTNWWDIIVRLPELTTPVEQEELSQDEWNEAYRAIQQATQALIEFRKQEGQALYKMFALKINNIEQLLSSIVPYEKERTEKIRQRLEERLCELKGVDYDKNRLEQELIYYIEKLDISEEKQRLTNHLKYFRETLDGGCGQGKKLGFIAQEMGREINTTGSKSNLAEMQNIVVKMKDELEQIKEQVLNVL
ncbi:YicC family protein [Alloprevotella tannerae]|uniref:YicC/YloC family endoribonuclease n=1 Tax=Alloprevotella tannerae TaxID=76122 RepID=UPI001EDC7A89|nr:YicC/YloC family endoribonuclease [Alloprevotella tannerae]MCG2646617.1 YicC family protein [Alloprevotella tannerae]MCG2650150.1 YicC family protein [Alloprevotella tannerae]